MQPSDRSYLFIHERLRAETHSVRPHLEQCVENLGTKRSGGAFNRDFSVGPYFKSMVERVKKLAQVLRGEHRRSPSTQVDRIYFFFKRSTKRMGQTFCVRYLHLDSFHISIHLVAREDTGGEIAEAALRAAKRNGNVDADRHWDEFANSSDFIIGIHRGA